MRKLLFSFMLLLSALAGIGLGQKDSRPWYQRGVRPRVEQYVRPKWVTELEVVELWCATNGASAVMLDSDEVQAFKDTIVWQQYRVPTSKNNSSPLPPRWRVYFFDKLRIQLAQGVLSDSGTQLTIEGDGRGFYFLTSAAADVRRIRAPCP